jgi:hypothetical protein
MVLKIFVNINGKAKQNRRKGLAEKEERRIKRSFAGYPDIATKITESEGSAKRLCKEYIKHKVDAVIISGGDGTVQYHLTTYFKELYKSFGKGLAPIEFAHRLNRMALDPSTGLVLPAIYHRRKGTVNFYGDTLRMGGDVETIAERVMMRKEVSLTDFPRTYVPVFMLFPKDDPYNLDDTKLMTTYADGFLDRVFEEYYAPKKKGKDASIANALEVIGRTLASATLDNVLPRDSPQGAIYKERYVDTIMHSITGEVKIDDRVIVAPDEKRIALSIGAMGVNLYGLKPFYRMPRNPEKFVFFEAGKYEKTEDVNINNQMFQVLVGNPELLSIAKQLPNIYLGTATNVTGLTDTLARRVEIAQDEDLAYIADGSTETNGKNAVIEMAYLQPFVLLDYMPQEPKGSMLEWIAEKGFQFARRKFADSPIPDVIEQVQGRGMNGK